MGGAALYGDALIWGVKRSLRDYVADGGEVMLSAGATASTAGFVFPPSARGAAAFDGAVEFSAYGGMLHFVLADPEIDGDTLTVVGRDGRRVPLGALTPTDEGYDTALLPEGAGVFDGMYPAGAPLDPVRLAPVASLSIPETIPEALS